MSEPKSIEIFAAQITGRGSADHLGPSVQRSMKLWAHLDIMVEALVQNTDRSRNEILNQLIEGGLEALTDHLTQEEADRLLTFIPKAKEASA